MKKSISILALALLTATAAFAEPAMLAGKIKAINLAPGAGLKPQLTVIDAQGKESKLTFSTKTTISDKSGQALTAAKLTAGEQVNVKVNGSSASSIQVEA